MVGLWIKTAFPSPTLATARKIKHSLTWELDLRRRDTHSTIGWNSLWCPEKTAHQLISPRTPELTRFLSFLKMFLQIFLPVCEPSITLFHLGWPELPPVSCNQRSLTVHGRCTEGAGGEKVKFAHTGGWVLWTLPLCLPTLLSPYCGEITSIHYHLENPHSHSQSWLVHHVRTFLFLSTGQTLLLCVPTLRGFLFPRSQVHNWRSQPR